MDEKLYSLNDLVNKIPVSLHTLREVIKSGDLVAHKIGNRYIVTETNLQEYLKNSIVQPTKKQSV